MSSPPSLLSRLFVLVAGAALLPVVARKSRFAPPALRMLGEFAVSHRVLYVVVAALLFATTLLLARAAIHLWLNVLRPRISKTYTRPITHAVPFERVDLLTAISAAAKDSARAGSYFLGHYARPPKKKLFGKPVERAFFVSEKQRTMHMHVLGQTGSGKSASVLFPLALQDIIAGKPVVVIDAKGSEENIRAMRNLCAVAGRTADLRIFSLPFPHLSHTYNPLWVAPRTPENPAGGDPLAVSERVFSVFARDMTEPFYKNSSEAFFRGIISVLHGLVDEHGYSRPFTFHDVLQCLQREDVLQHCLDRTVDRDAAANVGSQIANLGQKAPQTLMGLQNLVQNYTTSPLLNVCNPDIVIDEVFERNLIVYWQLPANYYAGLTQAIGKMVLQEIQQAGSRRQIYRESMNQRHAAISIDEFYNFAYDGFIDALNKLRDANFQFLLAHQSISDLERVSKEFSGGVWDNTRTKIVLYQNNPALCEQISKSIGTHQTLKTTARRSVGALALAVDMGEQSVREVEEFRLHPNAIKSLQPFGQAYVVESNEYLPLNLGCLPEAFFKRAPVEPTVPRKPEIAGLNLRGLLPKQSPVAEGA